MLECTQIGKSQPSCRPTILVSPMAAPVLVRAHHCQKSPRRTSPLTVQNARKMGAARTTGMGIAELLEKYKKTQASTLEMQRTMTEKQKREEARRSAAEPDVPMASGGSVPRKLTLEERERLEAEEKAQEEKLGINRWRNKRHLCANPECQDPLAEPEVDADGNSVCPSCGYSDENAAPEFEGAGQQDISDLEGGNRRTFLQDGGADNRTGQEWQDDANRELYVIEARDVPGATEAQRWWANNRLNQSTVWADYMGEDRGKPDGFAIAYDEIQRIKRILRTVCIFVARYAPNKDADDDDEEEEEEVVEQGKPSFGSPLLWTILLTLEMIAQRPGGFTVTTAAMQQTATLRALHEYMRRFQGKSEKRYVEMLGAFYTRAKGMDAKLAQQTLDRVKMRFAAWHPLGTDPDKLAAKVKTFHMLLKKSKALGETAQGEPIGLSAPVINGEQPALLAPQPNQITSVQDLAKNKGTYNTSLVDRAKEQAKGINYFKPKPWDRADKSLLKRDPKARKSEADDDDNGGDEAITGDAGPDDSLSSSDSDDDDFGVLNISKQDRRMLRKAEERRRAALAPSPAQPMDVEEAPAPAPAAASSAGGAGGSSSSSSASTAGDAPNAQLANYDDDALQLEIGKQVSQIEMMRNAGKGDAEYMEMLDQQLREMQAELQRRKDVAAEAAAAAAAAAQQPAPRRRTDLDDWSDDSDDDDDDTTSAERPEPVYSRSDGLEPAVPNADGVVTSLPDDVDDEDSISRRAISLLSFDLSEDAFARQQEEQLALAQEEQRRLIQERAQEAADAAAQKVAEQEAREAIYRQDGPYDRNKDIRNDMEWGKQTKTPTYEELLMQGRKARTEYKGKRAIRALSYAEVVSSANYHRHGFEFLRFWQQLQREWRAEQAAKLEKLQNAEAIKEESRQRRLLEQAARQVKREAEEARKEEGRQRAEWNLHKKREKEMMVRQDRGKGQFTMDVQNSNLEEGKWVLHKAEERDQLVPTVMPEDKKRKAEENEEKEYTYDCAKCGLTRMVKGTKPQAGWDCADGGYACKRQYTCKSCPRTFWKEGDPSDDLECKDVGKKCMPVTKKQKK